MADYREILHERLYVRVPGTDKLRKTAANRHKHLLANGWRELERSQAADHIMVKYERTGHAPMKARLPKQGPEIRIERRPRRDDNRRGGGRRRAAPSSPPTLDACARRPDILRPNPGSTERSSGMMSVNR